MEQTRVRVGLHAATALAIVVGLYGSPLVLTALLGLFEVGGGAVDTVFVYHETREAVVWIPPRPDAPEGDEEADDDALADADPGPEEPSNEPATPDVDTPPETLAVVSPEPDTRRPKVRRPVRRARPRRQRPPPPPPTAKEIRKEAREDRRDERRAERKQCRELVDQIVEAGEDDYWVGRELVNCYRLHPEQFIDIGGAWWNEVKGKKKGVRIHVSSKERGDVGRAAGFKSGDVVLSINGIPIRSDFTGALAATQVLRGHGRVKILRAGDTRVLKYDVVSERKLEKKRIEMMALAQTLEDTP